MLRARTVSLMAVAFALSGALVAQDKDKKTDPEKKAEPTKSSKQKQLPAGWRDLNLSDEQKQKVYAIKDKYTEDIDKLEEQIKEMKGKMLKEQVQVLTAAQKKKLEDGIKAKLGSDK